MCQHSFMNMTLVISNLFVERGQIMVLFLISTTVKRNFDYKLLITVFIPILPSEFQQRRCNQVSGRSTGQSVQSAKIYHEIFENAQ